MVGWMAYLRYFLSLCLLSSIALAVDDDDFQLRSDKCIGGSEKCLPDNVATAIMSQRDISYNVSIDKQPGIGIDLARAIFNVTGYTETGLTAVEQVLDVGFTMLVIDAYFNDYDNVWQLCPGPVPSSASVSQVVDVETEQGTFKCQKNVTLDRVWEIVSEYIKGTDTDLSANIISVRLDLYDMLKPKGFNQENKPGKNEGFLSESLDSFFTNRIYTPPELVRDRDASVTVTDSGLSHEGFPTSHYFLFTEQKRLMAVARNVSLTNYDLDSEKDELFVLDNDDTDAASFGNTTFEIYYTNNTTCGKNYTDADEFFKTVNSTSRQSSWRTIVDTPDKPFTNESINDYVACGFNPVLSTKVRSIDNLIGTVDASLWSWAQGDEPKTIKKASGAGTDDSQLQAYRCAQLHKSGWKVGNCYEKLRPLCRKQDYAYQWVVGDQLTNYFEAMESCPEGTQFSVPRTPLQQTAARLTVEQWYNSTKSNSKRDDDDEESGGGHGPVGDVTEGFPVWIDLNSIAASGCWVTGGPYANCKYHQVSYDRNQLTLLAVAGAACFFLLVLALSLRADKVPTRSNQTRWRRLVNKMNQEEYHGVPA